MIPSFSAPIFSVVDFCLVFLWLWVDVILAKSVASLSFGFLHPSTWVNSKSLLLLLSRR